MHRAARLLILAGALGIAVPAFAGQVRIDLNSGSFDPNDVSLNVGDHVVWVWNAGSHTVTSGTSPNPDNLYFNTAPSVGPLSNGGTAFTWKSTLTGNRNFFCITHFSFMTGVLRVQSTGIAVSDFRITEVEYGQAGGLDRIEVTNLGDASGDLGRYRISVSTVATELDIVPLNSVVVPPGGRVTIHANETGVSTATDLYMGGASGIGNLPTTGSVALFAPYRLSTSPGPLTADQIIDFVQWGAAGQPNAATALSAAVWPSGEFVSGESLPGYSISFCGSRTQHGSAFWSVTTPNFGSGGICTTPALNTSWGRIKTLYR